MVEFHQNLYLVITELHELKELMFSLLDKKENCIAEYSFVSCSVMNKVVKVFVIYVFTCWQVYYCVFCKSAVQ